LSDRTQALIDEVDFLSRQPENVGVDLIAKAHSSSEVSCCSPASSSPSEDENTPDETEGSTQKLIMEDDWPASKPNEFEEDGWAAAKPIEIEQDGWGAPRSIEIEENGWAPQEENDWLGNMKEADERPMDGHNQEINERAESHGQETNEWVREVRTSPQPPVSKPLYESPYDGVKGDDYSKNDGDSNIIHNAEWRKEDIEKVDRHIEMYCEEKFGLWNVETDTCEGSDWEARQWQAEQLFDLQEGKPVHPREFREKQPTGRVVAAWANDVDPERMEESKKHIGYIRTWKNLKFRSCFRFSPLDQRVPPALLPKSEVPKTVLNMLKSERKQLYFEVKYMPWERKQSLPFCSFIEQQGTLGEVETETKALLHRNNITHTANFSEKVLKEMAILAEDFRVPPVELAKRKDCRNLAVFSIDPTDARDLDDALSIEALGGNKFRIGIHIADVTYFVPLLSETDKEARYRGTSVYLVQETIPMLPRILCEKLCSLKEREERLAYSIFLTMDVKGEISKDTVWFGRTVIKNKCRLDYLQAQKIIDGVITPEEMPESLKDSKSLQKTITDDLRLFWQLAIQLRKRRFEDGALTLNRGRINVELNDDSEPVGVRKYPIYNSNYLIEEFMLLANMLVAQRLVEDEKYRDFALLRNHPPPRETAAQHVLALCRAKGWSVDISSSKALEASLRRLESTPAGALNARQVVESLLTKPFRLAEYIIVGKNKDPESWHHFALNFETYTHFTSPIRRYADCVVHRQLSCILSGSQSPCDIHESSITALRCNERKWAAKSASELSQMMYFTVLLQEHPMTETAMIIDISKRRITFIIHKLGIEDYMELDHDYGTYFQGVRCEVSGDPPFCNMRIYWTTDEVQTLRLFDEVELNIFANIKENGLRPRYKIIVPSICASQGTGTSNAKAKTIDNEKSDIQQIQSCSLTEGCTPKRAEEKLATEKQKDVSDLAKSNRPPST